MCISINDSSRPNDVFMSHFAHGVNNGGIYDCLLSHGEKKSVESRINQISKSVESHILLTND